MAGQDNLCADPLLMQGFAEALGGAAQDLRRRFDELDGEVSGMLAGWQGKSGTAFASSWELWRRGAGEVQLGLSILQKGVGLAGQAYATDEAASTQALRELGHG